jgi:predicted unusual protein kinase regulating ubiquinone biosynthesis (AarF/ABC1/UbiB family)
LFSLPLSESEEAIKIFARFTYQLQRSGLFHDDYNTGNVLYYFNGSDYKFTLIDNNRLRFINYSFRAGIKNLKRLNIPVDKLGVFSAEYANAAHSNEIMTLSAIARNRLLFRYRVYFKQWFKKHNVINGLKKVLLRLN